ncbi:hypothetical protein [Weissella cibaria]|uniref:hypothetical protein n=1 Tax=Weissella cibaria TaxID=137591 RepID=UPI003D3686CC
MDTEEEKSLDRFVGEAIRPFMGLMVQEIEAILNISLKRNDKGQLQKSALEQLMKKIFGVQKMGLKNIPIFVRCGIIPKTVVHTSKGGRTEDTKFVSVDFKEWTNPDLKFEDSRIYNYFSTHQILWMIFEESEDGNVKFLGVKRYKFQQAFIDNEVRITWELVRYLVNTGRLKEEVTIDKKTGLPKLNSTGVVKTAINFPKSKDYIVFLRGGAQNSSNKTEEVNGIKMYKQFVWVKGAFLADQLQSVKYI